MQTLKNSSQVDEITKPDETNPNYIIAPQLLMQSIGALKKLTSRTEEINTKEVLSQIDFTGVTTNIQLSGNTFSPEVSNNMKLNTYRFLNIYYFVVDSFSI